MDSRLIVSVRSLCAAIHPKILLKLRRGHVFFDHRRSGDPGDTNARRRISPAEISDPQGWVMDPLHRAVAVDAQALLYRSRSCSIRTVPRRAKRSRTFATCRRDLPLGCGVLDGICERRALQAAVSSKPRAYKLASRITFQGVGLSPSCYAHPRARQAPLRRPNS